MNTNAKYNKRTIQIVLGWDYIGVAHVERAFSDYEDAVNYIKEQEDGWTYSIEKTFFLEQTLPF